MLHLASLLDDACAQRPDELAIAAGEARLCYRELHDLGARLATAFADAGLAGERVATLLPNGPELLGCYLGCWGAGAIAVPFEYVDAPPEIRYGLADSGARWLVVQDDKLADLAAIDLTRTRIERVFVVGGMPPAPMEPFAPLLATPPRALPPVDPSTLAFILYTSGSTALPKGVTHSHASAAGIIASVLDALPRIDAGARIVARDSVSHMGGWIEVFPLLARGATVVLAREFDPERFYADLRTWRPTILGAHVDHLWHIVRHPGATRADFTSLDTRVHRG